ncbi:MAG: phosphotransferase [Verrucomicrobia bacterium]|nr:phosphotransferase [Verrucomicrobiota bacterium]MDA1087231.1 phosphotransferase [Verrucomicrobiota bacterium]
MTAAAPEARGPGDAHGDPHSAQDWEDALTRLDLQGLTPYWVSDDDPGRRAYVKGDRLYKIVLHGHAVTTRSRNRTLKEEFEILETCRGIAGVPAPLDFTTWRDADALIMERVDGHHLVVRDVSFSLMRDALRRLHALLETLSERGIVHNDLRPENLLLTADGGLVLIDFDQATTADPETAADLNLRRPRSEGLYHSLPGISYCLHRTWLISRLPSWGLRGLRSLRGQLRRMTTRITRSGRGALPRLPEDASPMIISVRRSWEIAQRAHANAAGQDLAYYSLTVRGYTFPGERPWGDRWAMLSGITRYSGQRVLELGCNQGLLSSYLLKHAGASAALGIDVDAQILESARLLATAFDVEPEFRQTDLDSDEDWESGLTAFEPDIVFALNVLNWVLDKERLLRFLGTFEQVIFEGHESITIESNRLREAGFQSIHVAGLSERKRAILFARKQGD